MASKNPTYAVTVKLLDGCILKCNCIKNSKTTDLLESICEYLKTPDRHLFGVKYKNKHNHYVWMVMHKPISKLLKKMSEPYDMRFQLKFYPTEKLPSFCKATLELIVCQIESDFVNGRVICSKEKNLELIAHILIVRKITGDFDDIFGPKHLPCLPQKDIDQLKIEYQKLRFNDQKEAIISLIARMHEAGCYGLDPHPFDPFDLTNFVGFYPRCISVIQDFSEIETIPWFKFQKVVRNRSKIIIVYHDETNKKSLPLKFKKSSMAKNFERCTLIYALFYSNYTPRPTNIRRAWTTILRRTSIHSDNTGLSDKDGPLNSSVFIQSPPPDTNSNPSNQLKKFSQLARASTTLDPRTKPKSLIFDKSDDSLSESSHSTDSTNSHSKARTCPPRLDHNVHSTNLTDSQDINSNSSNFRSPYYITVSTFQVGFIILIIALILFFILLGFK